MAEILIIDDDAVTREIMTAALEVAGHHVREAQNGADGIALVRKYHPALVVTDLMMPEKEGVEVIMELRQREPDIAILAVSGVPGNDLYLHVARELGADAVLQKPVSFDRLVGVVSELLNGMRHIADTDAKGDVDLDERRRFATEIQNSILAVMRDLEPQPLTNAEMAAKLEGFAPAHEIAINMRAMAVDGRLESVLERSASGSETRRYRLRQRAFAA
jgi:DNA-binding response OmpR family regulator